ncbi:FtsX-like permease family protein [Bacteroides sp.]|uniref:ABC transporter permease n=1 Tax=Bacteroides sp. TaxID=29523 RepID=UPI0026314E08|nr:FtsX-like permease family protein [Bacteroides sp.]
MIRHLITLIWNQRKQNGWIFAELTLVLFAIFMLTDIYYSKFTLYNQPLGYDIARCWRLHLEEIEPGTQGYVGEQERGTKCWDRICELTDRLMATDEVEAVGGSFNSCPYSQGNSWTTIAPAGADSINASPETLHSQVGDVGYFEVFNIHDVNGKRIRDLEDPAKGQVIITEKLAEKFFPTQDPRNRLVDTGVLDVSPILAVAPSIRESDFEPATASFYVKASGALMGEYFEWYRPKDMEYSIRMKRNMTQDEIEAWLASLGDGLVSGNIYVNAVTNFEEMRNQRINVEMTEMKMSQLVCLFLLLNVFFGITGTFWMRTQARRAETGLRMALGASKGRIISWLNAEGVLLLLLAAVPIAIIVLNLNHMDLLASEVSYSLERWLIEIGISLGIMTLMILLGIAVPAYWIMKEQPAEALHYE